MMTSQLLAAVLIAATPSVETYSSGQHAAEQLAGQLQTGTLLFSEGDCLAIRVFTKSKYTHVAAVVMQSGEPMVYDSMNGTGVRRMPLREYIATEQPHELHVMTPRQDFTPEQAEQFETHLEEQLGRPYAVKHHLTGERVEGLHCAEYVTDALMAACVMHAQRPPRVSPASLAEGALASELYASATTIALEPPAVEEPAETTWCQRMWLDTKRCTTDCCVQMRRWFLCR